MATTFTHAIESNSASDAVNLGSHASIDDLTGFTVGLLMKHNGGTAGYGFSKHSASATDGWQIQVQTSGRIDPIWDRATTNASAIFSSGVPSVAGTTWCWVFVQFDSANGFTSSNAFKVYSGNYGGALTNKTGASIVAGSGAYNTDAAQSLKLFSNGISVGCRTTQVAFIGIWSTLLSEATMDSYASDMSGNGGLAAAVDYVKWDSSMTSGATSANGILTGTYVSTPALVSGPDTGSYTLVADVGTYTLSGQDAGLVASRLLTAEQGSYALSGQDALLLRGLVLVADHGTYALSGQDATLLVARLLVAAEGAYTVAGQDALLLASRLLTADNGVYTLSGQDADLIYSGSNPTLIAEAGLYTLSGQDALLLASRVLTAESGSYVVSGQDALLLAARLLTAEHATYTLSGQAASLLVSRGLVAEAGTYTVSGQDALLLASRILTASHGSYVLTGQDATLTVGAAVLPAAILVVDASGRRLLSIDASGLRLVLDADDSARRVLVLAQPLLPQ